MAHKPRKDMIAETRAKLIAAGRKAFGEVGFAEASMDSFTADVGLTRGALYHHFGDKKGLLEAVIVEMDAEMAERLRIRSAQAPTRWEGFVQEGIGYIEMALEPEVRRIMFRDAPAVLGDPAAWPTANGCIEALKASLNELAAASEIAPDTDFEAIARLVSGASTAAAQWIASADAPETAVQRASDAYRQLVEGLLCNRPAR
jgi:AcrR family transcriptional regulator